MSSTLLAGSMALAQPAPLMVVYGPEAPSREGDPDHVERLFIEVPADLPDRLYLRIFDPEPGGAHDTRYGRSTVPTTTRFTLSGGEGALTGAPTPSVVADGAPPAAPAAPGPAGGQLLAERSFDEASPTDDAWVTLAPFTAADGEQVDGRAYLRLEVIGEAGDYGNAFTVEVSLSPDRSDPPAGVRLFAHEPTIRWREGADPTEVRFDAPEGDAAPAAELRRRRGRARPRRHLRRGAAALLRPGRVAARRVRRTGRHRGAHPARRRREPERRDARALRRRRPAGRPRDAAAAGAGAAAPDGGRRRAPARQLHLGRLRRLRLHRRRPARLPLALRRRRREQRSRHRPPLRRAGPVPGRARGPRRRRPRRPRRPRRRSRCTSAPPRWRSPATR